MFQIQQHSSTAAKTLHNLYWFVQIVECGSFSVAASQAGVAKSSLSRRLAELEQLLGVQLLSRSTRQLAMTRTGEQVFQHAQTIRQALQAIQDCARESTLEPSGLLNLSLPGALAEWILPVIADFRRQYPKVQCALSLGEELPDLLARRLDLALSLQPVPADSSNLVARPLAQLDTVLVGHPALLAELGHPQRLEALNDSQLLALGTPGHTQPWPLQAGPRTLQQPALRTENLYPLLCAVRAGLGLACLPLHCCHAELERGELLAACPDSPLQSLTLHALTLPHRAISQGARLFIQHLQHWLASHPQPGIQPLGN